MAEMKAITCHGPWARAIRDLVKLIETRGHGRFKSLVGQRIAIHEGLHFDRGAAATMLRAAARDKGKRGFDSPSFRAIVAGYRLPDPETQGRVVATARVRELRRLTKADEVLALCPCDESRWGLVFQEVMPLTHPRSATGRQGIWTWQVPADVCRVCGCGDYVACVDDETGEACHWVSPSLCSACA